MPFTALADATQVAYRTAGTAPPDLFVLHGWAGSATYFDRFVSSLDLDRVRATAVDLAGHGESPGGADTWSLDSIDDAVLAAADAVGAGRFVALGFSMAGKFVQHLALRNPERVAGLILVAGTQASAFALPPELLEDWYGRAGNAAAMEKLVRPFLTGPVDEGALARFCADAARVPRAALEGTMRVTLEVDFADRLASLAMPTLVVGGTRDELFTPELLRAEIVDRIPGARLALLDCGHEIPLERPRELAALIEAFLAGFSRSP